MDDNTGVKNVLFKELNRHRKENIENYKPKWREQSLNRVGFTSELFDNMLEKQGYVCALCKTDKPGGRWNRFFADHDHSSGKARGILCFSCNVTIGLIEQKGLNWINKANKYIQNGEKQ